MAAKALRKGAPARLTLRSRLEARREEFEATALTRVTAISDPTEVDDPAYAEGLRTAVEAALDYGLETIGRTPEHAPPVPVALYAQARLAARNGVALGTVLRRYFAGYSLLGFYLLEEAGREGLIGDAELRRLMAAQAAHFDRLIAAIGAEHERERQGQLRSPNRSQVERVERLLAGEAFDTAEIAYDFDGWHLGLIAGGQDAERAIAELAASVDCRRLTVQREECTSWAWLRTRRRLDSGRLLDAAARSVQACPLALGESLEGLDGWRLTHRQAVAALPMARRGDPPVARYADVALIASAFKDELLTTSLRRLYLDPLEGGRKNGGATLRQTLRAYFTAQRNSASAGAALGVTRQTVNNRLRTIEERLGISIDSCAVPLEIAVRIDEAHVDLPMNKWSAS